MPALTVPQAFQVAVQHYQTGRLAEAEALCRQILGVQSDNADALNLLGVLALQVGKYEVALQVILRALTAAPANPAFHVNLGEAYRMLGRLDEAIPSYRHAIALQPDLALAHCNLGIALMDKGQLDEAVSAYRQTLELKPDMAEAHNNLGNALRHLGRIDEAVASYRRALEIQPGFAVAHNNLGVALRDLIRLGEATTSFQRALEFKPDYAEASTNLGNVLLEQGRIEEAIAGHRQAIAVRPGFSAADSNLLLALHYLPEFDAPVIEAEHRRWSTIHATPLAQSVAPHANDSTPERRLRVGYVSSDFRDHAVASFFEGLLAHHDSAAVEVYCYDDFPSADEVNLRLRGQARHWRESSRLSDEHLAELIRRDGIDILVDLAGHTARHRLLAFARKPAPVQVTWLGYPNTTGLQAIDYRFTDALADPPGSDGWHAEKLVRLPQSAWCYRPPADAPPVCSPPCASAGRVSFGSFNTQQKINDPLIELWAGILKSVPGSRLILKNRSLADVSVRKRVQRIIERAGAASGNFELLGHLPTAAEHLAAYGQVDIALDTFPYHGTTTTCEAMWMGVPVVTLAGRAHVSRVGVSLLTNVGVPELIAKSPEEYVHLAVTLAQDVPRLTTLRSSLRPRMIASPLVDGPCFARHIEAAYREMWRCWCTRQRSATET